MEINLSSISYRALVSMPDEATRRTWVTKRLLDYGVSVEWHIPVPIAEIVWSDLPTVFAHHPRYASQALSLHAIVSEAQRRDAAALLLLEDDIVFHVDFPTMLARLQPPSDWSFLYLGGRNCGIKEQVGDGLMRSDFVSDLHAVVLRWDVFDEVKRALIDPWIYSALPDFRIATLHRRFTTYLCRPNLVWQTPHTTEANGEAYCNYTSNGDVVTGQGD